AVVERHHVMSRRYVDDELADRIRAHRRRTAVDRRVQAGVVGLTQDDLLAGLHIHLRVPRSESSWLELAWRAPVGDALHIEGECVAIDRARRRREIRNARDHEARVSYR